MFNRSGYNKINFNRVGSDAIGNISASAFLSFSATCKIGRIRKVSAVAGVSFGGGAALTRTFAVYLAPAEISIGALAAPQKRMFVQAFANVDLGAQATYYAYGVEEMSLPGLVMRPGDELVIDTDLMIVTLNGVNVARYVSMNSQFIRLLASGNTLIYQDASGQTRKATVRVEWKPRWL
jgi:hypothetical protein